jgi:hypothetical protein
MGMTTMTTTLLLAALLLPSELLHPSGELPAAGPGTDGPVQVSLGVLDGHMTVPVHTADGTELTFLVSTGAAVSVLSESGAARAGDQDLMLGSIPLDMQGSQTLEDARLTVGGTVVDGMVGINTLNRFDVLFDVPGGRMVLKPVGPSVSWAGVTLSPPIRLRVYHGIVLALDVEVQGRTYPAMLELGAPALLVNQRVLDETGVADGATAGLVMGGTAFDDVPVRLSDHPTIARFSPSGDGFVIVGTPPALTCPVAVSWAHREMRTCLP